MPVVTGVFVENAIKSAKEDKDFFMINNMREVTNGFAYPFWASAEHPIPHIPPQRLRLKVC